MAKKKRKQSVFFGRVLRLFPEAAGYLRKLLLRVWYFAAGIYQKTVPGERKRLLCMATALIVFVFSASQLVGYAGDYLKQRKMDAELREVYYGKDPEEGQGEDDASEADTEQIVLPKDVPIAAAADDFFETQPDGIPVEKPESLPELKAVPYPDNPFNRIDSKFEALKKSNRDIVGWLTVPELVDEAVVQRDNNYYLRRDYLGIHSQEGALFLDENVSLATRPYTFIVYGHNMKSGAKFGFLKKYENADWAAQHLALFFNTQYEDGEYVVFAASTIFVGGEDANDSVNLYDLFSMRREPRQQVIDRLTRLSGFDSPYSAEADDQLLMLVTCIGADTQRLVVACRRVHPGEHVRY